MHRRKFLNAAAIGLGGSLYSSAYGRITFANTPSLTRTTAREIRRKITTRNSARNLVFVLLDGAPSHVDTFDLKLGRETPNALGAQDLGGFQWPVGIMPKLAALKDKFSIVRSLTAVEAVHERAVYHLTTGHRHDAALVGEIPHFASAMSFKLEATRRAQDTLPSVVLFGDPDAKNGFFPIEHRGLNLSQEGQVPYLSHPFSSGESDARFRLLNEVTGTMGNVSDRRDTRIRIQKLAQRMMNDPTLQSLLGPPINEDEIADDQAAETQGFLRQCEVVARLLDADKGTRVVQMSLEGWDHHVNIYDPLALPALAGALDNGLSYLLTTLAAKPAKHGTGTLLDETLVVVAGEFGRTTNGLNESLGRDHYPYAMSALIAGGGSKGGRIIGSTDPTGSFVVDPGWSQQRYMGIGDLVATMYSSMGIDWSERFINTPSGRPFELVPTTRTGDAFDITSLFV